MKKVTDFTNPPVEELLSITNPVKIYRTGTDRSNWHRAIKIYPYEDVKKELLEWKDQNGFDTVNQSNLMESSPSLYEKLTNWSYVFDKTRTPKSAIYHMGLKTLNGWQNLESYKKNVLKLFPEELIYKFFKEGASMQKIRDYIKNAPKILRSTYQARKYRKKNDDLSIEHILDNNYPEVKKNTGFLPSQILYFNPFSDESISNFMNSLLYSGKDIRVKDLKKTPLGKRVHYFIIHPDNRSETKSPKKKNFFVGNYQKEISKYFNLNKLGDAYILNDSGSRGDIASLSEIEFSFFLSILAKYDPCLDVFPELKSKIDTPLEKILDPSLKTNTRILHEKERYSDGRFNAAGKSYLLELKKSDYMSPKNFFSSLSKYRYASYWFDGEKIDKRILFIDEIKNGNALKIPSDWIVLNGDEFKPLYKRAIDLLVSNEPDFVNYSPMNSLDSLEKTNELLHNQSHLLARKGYRKSRRLMKLSQLKNFHHLNSSDVYSEKIKEYKFHYNLDIDSLGIYPSGFIKEIPEKYLFFDFETNGLRNTGSQLISATFGERKNDKFELDVYFARTPFEAGKITETSVNRINSADKIFTYNGTYFDIPFLEESALVNLIKYKFDKPQMDLYLDYYKKICKQSKYPSASLKVFERTDLHISRRGDIPGKDIPKTYLKYLLGEEDSLKGGISEILFHNLLDGASMPFLLLHSEGYRFSGNQKEVSFENFKNLF